MNVFKNKDISEEYDNYYKTDFGKKVDAIEKKLILKIINNINKSTMLELGCGTGHWTDFFVKYGFKLVAVDSTEAMVNLAKQKNINAEFIVANAENLPFDDKSFEVISTITMLEFVDNITQVVSEIERVMKKNGYLIIGCLNKDSVLYNNKENDKVFSKTRFFSIDDISEIFQSFEIIVKYQGVYLNNNYEICDYNEDNSNIVPAFNAILLRRKK